MENEEPKNITGNTNNSVFRVAVDKDLLNLEGLNYNWKTKAWQRVTKTQEIEYFWKSMIVGDQVDAVKGLPNKGKRFFASILEQSPNPDSLRTRVFNEYINHFGECQGVKEFYKNYCSLKILDSKEGFIVPEPIEYKQVTKQVENLNLFS